MVRQLYIYLLGLFLLGAFYPISIYPQVQFIDSLKKVIDSSLSDTTKVDIINEVVFQNAVNFPEFTVKYSDIAIEKSNAINDSFRLSRSINRKAIAYYYLGDYNNAMDLYYQSLQISEKLNDSVYIATDYNNIGLVLLSENLYESALNFFQKSQELIEPLNKQDLLAKVYDNIGIAYNLMNQYDSALVWFQKSININRAIGQRQTLASNIRNVGNVFMHQENYSLALTHFMLALEVFEEFDVMFDAAGLYNSIALMNAKIGRFSEAEKYLKKAEKLIYSFRSSSLLLEYIKVNAEICMAKQDYKKAVEYFVKYNYIRDSIQISDRKRNYEQLRTIAETNEKIKDLELLKTVNKIQSEKIRDQRTIQIGIIILLSLSLLVIILILNTLRAKNRINRILGDMVEERTKELKLAKEIAERSDELKSTFLSNISHEVRTPMNAIVGFSELLLNKTYNENERNDLLDNIYQSTLQLLNIFEKISYLVQLENYEEKIVPEPSNIDELFRSFKEKYAKKIKDSNLLVAIEYKIDDSLKNKPLFIPIKNIQVIIDELIDNAIKFTQKGEVLFGVEQTNNSLNFYVKDTGDGISPDHLDLVFEKFTKFNSSHLNHKDGAGIGLAIIKKHIELIGGITKITSQKGQGTTVEFKVPI
jgi:signal transduction histidine kinase